jgi:hypothetical protein
MLSILRMGAESTRPDAGQHSGLWADERDRIADAVQRPTCRFSTEGFVIVSMPRSLSGLCADAQAIFQAGLDAVDARNGWLGRSTWLASRREEPCS